MKFSARTVKKKIYFQSAAIPQNPTKMIKVISASSEKLLQIARLADL